MENIAILKKCFEMQRMKYRQDTGCNRRTSGAISQADGESVLGMRW
jgi:hypothetical protein